MREEQIVISHTDDIDIYGTLNSTDNNSLIIFVHGLTGHQNEHQFFNAARFFPEHGFDTFRFDLYPGREKSLDLHKSTITDHAEYTDTVVDHFKGKYEKLFLVGHSLGAPSILMSDQEVAAVTFWDPSYCLDILFDDLVYDDTKEIIYTNWGTSTLIGQEMVDDISEIQPRLISSFKRPTKLIFAGEGVLEKQWKLDLDNISVEHERHTISGATHCFVEWGAEEELFAETLAWFEQF